MWLDRYISGTVIVFAILFDPQMWMNVQYLLVFVETVLWALVAIQLVPISAFVPNTGSLLEQRVYVIFIINYNIVKFYLYFCV